MFTEVANSKLKNKIMFLFIFTALCCPMGEWGGGEGEIINPPGAVGCSVDVDLWQVYQETMTEPFPFGRFILLFR